MPLFTPEELEALRRADAEIDATFCQTAEEIKQSRARDKAARLAGLPDAERKLAEHKRAYREANREKLAEYQRAYREANREKLAEYKRAYREANWEKLAEYQRAHYYTRTPNDRFRAWMQATGTTQKAMAEKIGVTQGTISMWYTGASPVNMQKLRAALPALAKELEERCEEIGSRTSARRQD